MRNDQDVEFELPFILTEGERISALWIKISTELEKKLDALRKKNDNPNLSESETAALRGQIKSFKTILGLGDEMPPLDQ